MTLLEGSACEGALHPRGVLTGQHSAQDRRRALAADCPDGLDREQANRGVRVFDQRLE